MYYTLNKRYYDLMWIGVGAPSGSYFAWEKTWKSLNTSKAELDRLWISYRIAKQNNPDKCISWDELDLTIRCIEKTIQEYGIEEFFTITWIYLKEEAKPLLKDLQKIIQIKEEWEVYNDEGQLIGVVSEAKQSEV